jgi:putative inorganic carbon (HCO3(-)) transporter
MTDVRTRTAALLKRLTEYALYGLIFSLPISKSAVEICATTAIICWISRKALVWNEGERLIYTELNLPIAAFYLVGFLSIFWSTHVDISVSAFWRKLTEYVLLYFIVAETMDDRKKLGGAVIALAASAAITCLDGVYQKLSGYDLIRGYPLHSMERITAAFKFPNGLSTWFLAVFFPFLSLAIFARFAVRTKAALWALVAIMSYCFYYSYTRGAFIAFTAALAVMFFMAGNRRSRVTLAVVAAAALSAFFLLPEGVKDNMYITTLSGSTSVAHRLEVWGVGWDMFMDRPLTGQGLNTFMANYERFRAPGDTGIWYAHNSYLQIAAETGIFGLLAFLWFVWRTITASASRWGRIRNVYLKYLNLGLFCGVVSFLLLSFVEVTHFSVRSAVLFYLAVGLLISSRDIGLREAKE